MSSVCLILTAAALLCLSGVPACLLPARSMTGQRITIALMLIGGILGMAGVATSFVADAPASFQTDWPLPFGRFAVAVDPISNLFLALIFSVPALGSIYGHAYWKQTDHPDNGRRLGLFYGLLAGSMAFVAVARDGVLFLIAWEAMALAAYFAATVDEDNPAVQRAGWVYLIATHIGTLTLIAMFALWGQTTGSFALLPGAASAMPAATVGTLFVLAVIGFGFKAGLMPLHVWLPGAHANAPSHVSAVMSGVMLKMGIYGIVRMTCLLPAPPIWCGGTLMAVGAITGIAGIAFAIAQHDLKRLLAYSSIENIGIIVMGIGLAVLGRSMRHADWVVLGLGGALFHVCNHALFKSLLFFASGSIIHAAGTREIDKLGGLAKLMPRQTLLFAVGAAAICALPPLNGFAGEWLLYLGFFRTLDHAAAASIAAVALAMIGALAVACFVKLFGAVFLGSPRTDAAAHAHDPPPAMLLPMSLLAAGCIVIGLFPMLAAPPLQRAAQTYAASMPIDIPAASLATLAPMQWLTFLGLILLGIMLIILLILKTRSTMIAGAGTWDCGYARPTSRIQYTGSSFGQSIVSMFTFILRPRRETPAVRGLFAGRSRFATVVPDTVLDRMVLPLFRLAGRYLPWVRMLQQGRIQLYILYFLFILIVLLLWATMGVAR